MHTQDGNKPTGVARSALTRRGRSRDNSAGRFVHHCLMLEHKDMGMMRQFVVLPGQIQNSGPPTPTSVPVSTGTGTGGPSSGQHSTERHR